MLVTRLPAWNMGAYFILMLSFQQNLIMSLRQECMHLDLVPLSYSQADAFAQIGYCGNSLTNNGASGKPTSSYMCSVPCAGDSSKNCGGGWTLSVYTSFSKTPPSPQPGSYNVGNYLFNPSLRY